MLRGGRGGRSVKERGPYDSTASSPRRISGARARRSCYTVIIIRGRRQRQYIMAGNRYDDVASVRRVGP